MHCLLSAPNIELGIFSRISNPAPKVSGNFNVSCESKALPADYSDKYHWNTVEGGYCLNIAGTKSSRVLKGEGGKAAGVEIPFNFYSDTRKMYDPNRPQNFTDPIGDGTWGIGFFDWDYKDATLDEPKNGRNVPKLAKNWYSVPVKSLFEIRIDPRAAGTAYPAGIYTANFTFNWVAGAVKYAGTYPKVTSGSQVCSQWVGEHGGGSVNMRLEIKKYCYVKVNRDIDFGKQLLLNETLTERGEIEADCSEGTLFGIGIDKGQNSERAGGSRAMLLKGGEDIILYDLYKNQGLAERWGNDWGSEASIQRGTGSGAGQKFPVWASVPPQGGKSTGTYQDTVIVEVRVLDPGGP